MDILTFRSTYDYSDSTGPIEIPIILIGPAGSVRLLAKVDTGADFCIFQRDYAERLGIDVEAGVRVSVGTATGRFDAYGHSLTMSCLEWEFETTVYFAGLHEFGRNVVGRSGWLQNFRVAMIHHDSVLYLSHYDDRA